MERKLWERNHRTSNSHRSPSHNEGHLEMSEGNGRASRGFASLVSRRVHNKSTQARLPEAYLLTLAGSSPTFMGLQPSPGCVPLRKVLRVLDCQARKCTLLLWPAVTAGCAGRLGWLLYCFSFPLQQPIPRLPSSRDP